MAPSPETVRPKALRPGDVVAVVAPSSPFDTERFDLGLQRLQQAGLAPRHRDDITARHRYLAGDDPRRLAELQDALDDDAVRAVWMARGGYGSMRLLDRLDDTGLRRAPKLLVGFSDGTSLHGFWARAGVASVHGPMVARLGVDEPAAGDRVLDMVRSAAPPPALVGARTVVAGVAEGVLHGGNLTTLSRLIGTPYMPDLRGAILVLEDVGERPYRLDRTLSHFAIAGLLKDLAGVVLGPFSNCDDVGMDYNGLGIAEEMLAPLRVPMVAGLEVGHGPFNLAVPFGTRARLRADEGTLEFLESPVS